MTTKTATKHEGVVKWFDSAKGYGFIRRENGEDIFVHISAVRESRIAGLSEGDRVSFSEGTNPRNSKPCAESLELL